MPSVLHLFTIFVHKKQKIVHTIHQNMYNNLIKLIEKSIQENWDLKALTNYKGSTLQYKDVARRIEKIHIVFAEAGIKKGDKIAICGRNHANWCVTFLAVITYGAVAVPILHEFKPDNIHNIVNHSEAKMLFVGSMVWENLNEQSMPDLRGIVVIDELDIILSRDERLTYACNHLNEMFGKKYPKYFRKEHVHYEACEPDALAVINYTSGTTGYSKGVMLPYRSLMSNVEHIHRKMNLKPGDDVVSVLPMGHVFGLTFDFLYGMTHGVHLWFLNRMPSPKVIATSAAEIKPKVIACVPLVIEKIFKTMVIPKVDNKLGKILLRFPLTSEKIKAKAKNEAMNIFGNNLMQVCIGGAPFNAEVEKFLDQIKFPYTIAYGMTECGPMICNDHCSETRYRSCGKVVDRMEVRIDSKDPHNIPGEMWVRGENVMLGYYKDKAATDKVMDGEWLCTGDMATIDSDGYVYIKGRSKNMLLSASGQNIYPEEIESKLNNMPGVNESVVIMNNSKLVALIHPDLSDIGDRSNITAILDSTIKELNKELPAYSQIAKFKLWPEEFQKTAKKNIKRYVYNDINI